MVEDPAPVYPLTAWLTAAIATTALAVAVRFGAALAGVDVVVPERGTGPLVPLDLAPVVTVTLGAFVVAILAVLVGDRVLPARSRRVLRLVGLLLLVGSLAPLVLADLPTDSMVVLVVLHLLVGTSVLRNVVRP